MLELAVASGRGGLCGPQPLPNVDSFFFLVIFRLIPQLHYLCCFRDTWCPKPQCAPALEPISFALSLSNKKQGGWLSDMWSKDVQNVFDGFPHLNSSCFSFWFYEMTI